MMSRIANKYPVATSHFWPVRSFDALVQCVFVYTKKKYVYKDIGD